MIQKIDHINISVTNLKEATQFFTEILDFKVVHEGTLEGHWIDQVVDLKNVKAKFVALSIPNTETNLELIEYLSPIGEKDSKIDRANQIGFRHMAFTVKNIESIVGKLKEHSVKFFSEIQVYNHQKKLCYFLGPDDIILELAEYGNF